MIFCAGFAEKAGSRILTICKRSLQMGKLLSWRFDLTPSPRSPSLKLRRGEEEPRELAERTWRRNKCNEFLRGCWGEVKSTAGKYYMLKKQGEYNAADIHAQPLRVKERG